MFNVLLDPLPTEYRGFPIDSDFQIGIQIMQALEDGKLSRQEGQAVALSLLFLQEDAQGNQLLLPDAETALEGLVWFLTDWNHDHNSKVDKTRITDFNIDQWRIYSAFKQHYGINLNTDKLHFWEFMGLLTTLPECAYTRVIDIRAKKITSKMGKDEKKVYAELKKVYALDQLNEVEYTDNQKEAIDEFDRMMEEQKKIREAKKLAEDAFKEML
ncbi:MAG: hypothetical protein HFH89_09555 [Lachnospiraceae bacterium]|nr:Gp15 family bacteriophage protein [uncultured Acetatifactor sp.]MCI8287880.1 hypothetical protein [Lachnospiraceae bacterium]